MHRYALLACLHSPCWPPSRTRCSFVLIRRDGLLVRLACLPSFSLLANISYRLLVSRHSPCCPTSPTRCSFDLHFANLHSDVWQKCRVRYQWPTSCTCCLFVLIRCAGLLIRVARLPSFSLLANISYRLLVGPHSPRWLTVPTRRLSALILHAGLLLLRVARLTSFLLTYVRTFGKNTVFGIGGLHLVRVARLSSFAALAHSYALLVCPHSPCWPTSRTGCSSALILHAVLLLRRVAHLTSILLTYVRTCGRNTVLGIGGLHLVHVARLSSFAALAYSYALLVCPLSPRWRTAPTRFSFDLVFADLHSDVWQKRRVRYWWPTSRMCCSFVHIRRASLLVRVARLPSFSLLANISYRLLVGPHSPRWLTVPTRCSSALILHAGLLLLGVARLISFLLTYIWTFGRNTVLGIGGLHLMCVARLTSFLLTYIRTFGGNTMLGIGGLHLVPVARLSSFAALAYSYALLVCPHSPRWPTAPTHCSFDLVFADLRLDVWQKRHVKHHWPTSRTCCSSALILHAGVLLLRISRLTSFLLTYILTFGRNTTLGIGGLHLIRVARLSSFATLAHSYALLVFPHSPCWPTSPTHSASTLILPYLLLVRVARLPSFSLLANISYLLLVGPHSLHWPTAHTRSVSALILPYLLLVCVAHLPLFSSLVYILYALLVCPYAPPFVPRTSRLDLGCWTLYHNIYIYFK